MIQQRLMIAEDDRGTREGIQRIFISRGWEVAMVPDLLEALKLLQDYKPHWVITSSELPDGPCDLLLPVIRADKRRTRIAIIARSNDRTRVAALQADLVVQRPVEPEAIYRDCVGYDRPSPATA